MDFDGFQWILKDFEGYFCTQGHLGKLRQKCRNFPGHSGSQFRALLYPGSSREVAPKMSQHPGPLCVAQALLAPRSQPFLCQKQKCQAYLAANLCQLAANWLLISASWPLIVR